MSSLVVQTSFLGDMVLTTPLIAWLAKAGTVDVVATPRTAGLLENNPDVREVIVYDKRGADRGVGGFTRLAARLRTVRYGAAYLAQGSVRSGALTLAAGIRERVGFASSAGRAFYTTRIPPIDNIHHAARLLSLGTRDPTGDVPAATLRPRLYPGPRERAAVDELIGGSTLEPTIALAPGSIWATKQWPYYADLARELRGLARLVVVGADADRPLAMEIVAAADGSAIDATGKLSLLASAELIGRARLLVTNDSSPLHLASAMNTPTLAIFGPTVPEFGFGPLAERSTVVGRDELACRPCDRHGPRRCPLGHWRCMREITADEVARIARGLLTPRTS
ncbi:MAG TPA: lipopolysaccharide heptosyltransferase II [Gemmatimonadaceae bacterium]|nr:lipopolysaccharide heptosyltransferase II [Gemmatimonadaceae bacterium]